MYDNRDLLEIAREISETVNQSDQAATQSAELLVEAGKMVVEAKKRVLQGEIGKIDWYEWAKEHIGLRPTRLDELHSIGSAENSLARALEIRGLAKARAKKHRDKKKAEPPRSRNGDETTGSTPAPDSGDPIPSPEPKSPPEGDTETAPDVQSPPEPAADEPQSPPEAAKPASAEAKERAELIRKFTAWAEKADFNTLRNEVTRIVDGIPYDFDRRPARREGQIDMSDADASSVSAKRKETVNKAVADAVSETPCLARMRPN